jgi:hypothetical protein
MKETRIWRCLLCAATLWLLLPAAVAHADPWCGTSRQVMCVLGPNCSVSCSGNYKLCVPSESTWSDAIVACCPDSDDCQTLVKCMLGLGGVCCHETCLACATLGCP